MYVPSQRSHLASVLTLITQTTQRFARSIPSGLAGSNLETAPYRRAICVGVDVLFCFQPEAVIFPIGGRSRVAICNRVSLRLANKRTMLIVVVERVLLATGPSQLAYGYSNGLSVCVCLALEGAASSRLQPAGGDTKSVKFKAELSRHLTSVKSLHQNFWPADSSLCCVVSCERVVRCSEGSGVLKEAWEGESYKGNRSYHNHYDDD